VRPILQGDRGPAVEDVQRRLRLLGADLGSAGIDGVFQGATLAAVRAFQVEHALAEDGQVGPETWSALVDATFSLGDRLLYLRFPHLHGADVRTLQDALNALGFSVGDPDGIFGAFAERAVREFQLNTGLPADGIVGPETVRVLDNLRHVWADRSTASPVASRKAPARDAALLSGFRLALLPAGERAQGVADRLENLMLASTPEIIVAVSVSLESGEADLALRIGESAPSPTGEVPAVLAGDGGDALAVRIEAALRSSRTPPPMVDVLLGADIEGERAQQRVAVGLLDGLCLGLAGSTAPVVP
jgi:peptidoglycan hydrolase-like protein with peptidoglycan-binding domain